MATACVKCNRKLEESLSGSPAIQCLLCIGEEINLLAVLHSLDKSGLKDTGCSAKCCVCTRTISDDDISCKSDHGHVCQNCFQFFQSNAGSPLPLLLQENQKWIVKSSLTVVGPYSEERIFNGIKAREFASLDEICPPRRFWTYLRDNDTFKEAITDVSVKDFREDDTVDITKSLTGSNFGTDPGIIQERKSAVVDVSFKETEGLTSTTKNSFSFVSLRAISIATLGVVLLAGLFVFTTWIQNRTDLNSFNVNDSKKMLAEHWSKGRYKKYQEEAFQFELNGFELNSLESVQLAAVLISRGESFRAKTILTGIDRRKNITEITLLESKIAYEDRNIGIAIQKLESLSQKAQRDERVRINLSFLKLMEGKLEESQLILPRVVSVEELNSNRSLVEMYYWLKSGFHYAKKRVDELESNFSYYLDSMVSFDLIRGILYLKANESLLAQNAFTKALNAYPDTDDVYRQNLYMIPFGVRFKIIDSMFSELDTGNESLNSAVRAIMAYRQGNKQKALKYLKIADSKNPDSSLIRSWLDLLISGQIQRVPSNIDPLFLDMSSPFTLSMAGEKCLSEKKLKCVKSIYFKLLSLDPRSPRTIHNLIKYYELSGNRDEAVKFFRRGIGVAPRYIPFLEMEKIYL